MPGIGKSRDVLVLLSGRQIPKELQPYAVRRALPFLNTAKLPENAQSSAQANALLDRLGRYVRVTAKDINLDSIRSISGVAAAWEVQSFTLDAVTSEELPISNDSLVSEQYALEIVGAREAWQHATGQGVVVGIIDTGIDWNHEDLRDALAISPKEDLNANGAFDAWPNDEERLGIPGDLNGEDDDDNGVIDDVIGADFVDQEFRNLGDDSRYDAVPFDEHGHGTLVAGVIAATRNNGKGIAGLACNARLRVMRAFDATGAAEEDDIASAVVYAALTGVDVINMSFGDGVNSPLLQDAIRYAQSRGCVLVASAGNSGVTSTQYPASYNGVIVVAATNRNDQRAPFSSTGPVVSLSAPGQSILTTSVNSRYRSVSGTSFSAPYTAAVAAMMIEKNPGITAEEIRGTLMASSKDLGQIGWDPLFGSGRLRADAALSAMGLSRVSITRPLTEEEFDLRTTPSIQIFGSNHVINFLRSEIAFGRGIEPIEWETVSTSWNSVIEGYIGAVPTLSFESGLYTLRVRSYGSDGRHHDCHMRVRIIDADSCRITSLEQVSAWFTDRKTHIITVSTNRPAVCAVTESVPADYDVFSTPRKYASTHSVVLPDSAGYASKLRKVHVTCSPMLGRAADSTIELQTPADEAAPTTGWDIVASAPWAGYVLDDVRDLYRDGSKCFAMNDLSDGGFGRTVIVQYDNGNWAVRDSLNDVYIPRAITDVNGNGRYELLCHVVGRTVLFEQQSPTQSLFSSILFADSTTVVNAAGAADIDGDGREEILALADNACYVYTCKGDIFSLLGIAKNSSSPPTKSGTNRVDEISVGAGDFNGNGRMEIAFSDTDGDLLIHEWNGSSFEEKYVFQGPGAGGSGFVAAGDVNADGRPDILHGVPDRIEADEQGEYGRQAWTYRCFSYSNDSGYTVTWQDHVAGVRYGIGYRNGVALANIDSVPGDEIILSAFPRLYLFGLSAAGNVAPKGFFNDVATPRVLTFDWNKDGVRELGIGTTVPEIGAMTGFTFVQQSASKSMPAPSSLRAYHDRADTTLGSVRLSWYPVDGASAYRIVRRVAASDSVVAEVQATAYRYQMRGLADSIVSFVVQALSSEQSPRPGRSSNRVVVDARPVIFGIQLERSVVSRRELRSGLVLQLTCAGEIDAKGLALPRQILRDVADTAFQVHARIARTPSGQTVQFVFPEVEYSGDSITLHVDLPMSRDLFVARSFTIRVVNEPPAPEQRTVITLSGVDVVSPITLHLRYSHQVDESALQVAAYTLRPEGSVVGVRRIDSASVALELDPAYPLRAKGVTYAVSARNVKYDTSHAIAQGAGNTIAFSVYGSEESDAYTYPQPLKMQVHDALVFAGLPAIADVEVLDDKMNHVIRLRSADGNGGLRWNLRAQDDRVVAPGMYFYVITGQNADGSMTTWPMKKLLIQR
jgi:subtilisin family serine protease